MRKICVVTGSRAEYGLLYPLLKCIQQASALQLQLAVTGSHLAHEFGQTYHVIEQDGFKIDKKVDMLLANDSPVAITKALGLGVIGFAEAFADLLPDLVVVLGDRYEMLAVAQSAMLANIPIAHIHGGEKTEGAIDESIRHAITKMSHLHFTSIASYRQRVIQLGEHPNQVHNVGALGVENISKLDLLSKSDLEQQLNFSFGKKNLLVAFHPETLSTVDPKALFSRLLTVLDPLEETKLIFTKSNADVGGLDINALIDNYVKNNGTKAISFTSMGQIRFLSTMQYIDAIIGNSSSGIIEAPSFKIGTINIGERQAGRVKADSIIDCAPSTTSINNALSTLYSPNFQTTLQTINNPYLGTNTSQHITDVLQTINLDHLLHKKFYDLPLENLNHE